MSSEKKRRQAQLLVLDDNKAVAMGITRMVKSLGMGTSVASSLYEAIGLIGLTEKVYDAAVLDLSLPDGTGAELIRPLLRREPICRSIMLSGSPAPSAISAAAQLGAHKFLVKPTRRDELVESVMDVLHSSMKWREIATETGGYQWKSEIETEQERIWIHDEAHLLFEPQIDQAIRKLMSYRGLNLKELFSAIRFLHGDDDAEIAEQVNCSREDAVNHLEAVMARIGAQDRSRILPLLLEPAEA